MPYEVEKVKSRVFYYLCMVLAGCILANIILRCDRNLQAFVISFVDSSRLAASTMRQTIFRVSLERAKQFVVVYLLYKVFHPKTVFSIGLSLLLFLFGFSLSCQMFYLGLQGVWFLMICLFPHFLIYIIALYYLAMEIHRIGEDKHKREVVMGVLIIMFVVGVLTESILSKFFLKNFLQYIGM